MVWRDPFAQKEPTSQRKPRRDLTSWPLASPFDRLAAHVVDTILFVPLLSLALAFLKRQIFITQLIGTEVELNFLVFIYSICIFAFGIFYQTFFLTWLGATPGKHFFGLHVCDVWTRRPPHWQKAFMRSLLWVFDFIALFPLLAVFSDARRRPLHDRFTDTVVLTRSKRVVGLPSLAEKGMARGFFAAFLFFLFLFTIVQFQFAYKDIQKSAHLLPWVGGVSQCEEIADWTGQGAKEDLSLALALFAASEITAECLDQEVDRSIWQKNIDSELRAMTYLGRSFAAMDESETSDEYLQKICEVGPGSEACILSQAVELWSEENWDEVDQLFTQLQDSESLYIQVWLVRHSFKLGRMLEVDRIVQTMAPNKPLSRFLGEYRVKALWQIGDADRAQEALSVLWENHEEGDVGRLADWLCYSQLNRSCQATESVSCELSQGRKNPYAFEDSLSALAFVRHAECSGSEIDGKWVKAHSFSFEMKEYLQKTFVKKESETNELFKKENLSFWLRQDSAFRALRQAKAEDGLKGLFKSWKETSTFHDRGWQELGESLFSKYRELGVSQKSIEVASELHRWHPSERSLWRLVEAHYEAKNLDQAWGWLKKVDGGRSPASTRTDRSQIRRELLRKFDRQ